MGCLSGSGTGTHYIVSFYCKEIVCLSGRAVGDVSGIIRVMHWPLERIDNHKAVGLIEKISRLSG